MLIAEISLVSSYLGSSAGSIEPRLHLGNLTGIIRVSFARGDVMTTAEPGFCGVIYPHWKYQLACVNMENYICSGAFGLCNQNCATSKYQALWRLAIKSIFRPQPSTYDHRHWKTRDPVRSPIDKPATARLVVGSVTTSESLVLYVSFLTFFV